MKKNLAIFFACQAVVAMAQTNSYPTSGNVGIGTLSANANLEIKSSSSPYQQIYLTTTRTFSSSRSWGIATNWASEGDLSFLQSTTSTNGPSVTRLCLDVNGNMGVGTTVPSFRLHVRSGNANSDKMTLGSTTTGAFALTSADGGAYGLFGGVSNLGRAWLQAGRYDTNTAYDLTLQASGGNVGIGTTIPLYRAVISNGGAAGLEIDPTGVQVPNGVGLQAYNRSTSAYTPLQLYGSQLILDRGNVGVGSSTPMSGVNNGGLNINKGDHSMMMLGSPATTSYGGVVQASDGKHRVFIGANMFDDPLLSWKNFQTGKGSAGISVIADYGTWGTGIDFYATTNDNDFNSRMKIDGNGNVGIGTNLSPASKLHIADGTGGEQLRLSRGTGAVRFTQNNNQDDLYLVNSDASKTYMYWRADGNIGIGNATPDAKLAVSGQVHAQEVKVSVAVPGPDYVFEKDYKLTSLDEIKNYIDQNKHLPEVPSAKEMEKDGIRIGEMNMLLLKKIEELTLYVIEQQQLIREQADKSNVKIESLEREISRLKEKQ